MKMCEFRDDGKL